jgi:hypothetical protein
MSGAPDPRPGWIDPPSGSTGELPSNRKPQGNGQDTQQAETADIDLSILRLNRRAPPSFPLDIFGTPWAGWISNAGEAACSPPDYVAAPLLATSSALIGNARWPQAWPGWEEPPSLWIGSVGLSGDGKTPGAGTLFRRIVPELDRRMAGDFPQRHAEWKAAAEIAEAQDVERRERIKRALKSGKAIPEPEAYPEPGEEPQQPRLTMGDVTHEKAAAVLATAAPKGLLMVRDELAGWLLGMSAYNDAARPFWLQAWNGDEYRLDRVKNAQPLRIPHNVVAWFGGIQPERLAEVMEQPDDGLLARFVWCWPDAIPFARPRTEPDKEFALRALDCLRLLEMHRNSDGTLAPILVPLMDAAQSRMEAFGYEMQRRRDFAAGLLCSSIGKARGIALRTALVLELLWWCARDDETAPPRVISDAALEAAIAWVRDYVIPMAERTFGDAALSQADRNITTLARWIAKEHPRRSACAHDAARGALERSQGR